MKKTIKWLLILLFPFLFNCQQLLIWSPDYVKVINGDIKRPYKVLGPVEAQYGGIYERRVAKAERHELNYEKFGDMKLHKTEEHQISKPIQQKPDIAGANERLLDKAYDQYGNLLASVIKVQYLTYTEYQDARCQMQGCFERLVTKARGFAVCFTDRNGNCVNMEAYYNQQKQQKNK